MVLDRQTKVAPAAPGISPDLVNAASCFVNVRIGEVARTFPGMFPLKKPLRGGANEILLQPDTLTQKTVH